MLSMCFLFFFFFSSRRRHTRFDCDWIQTCALPIWVRPDYDWFTNRDGLLTFWRGGVAENHDLDVIWPVGLRNTSDRAYTWPEGTTDNDKARVFRVVIGLQTAMLRDALPPGRTPTFHFTMYSDMP